MEIKIGPLAYEIVPMNPDGKAQFLGLADHETCKIYIDMEANVHKQGVTLIHEILHAINHLGGYGEEEENTEKYVRHVSTLLYQILNENKQLWVQLTNGEGLDPLPF